jgi:hypothetical protein
MASYTPISFIVVGIPKLVPNEFDQDGNWLPNMERVSGSMKKKSKSDKNKSDHWHDWVHLDADDGKLAIGDNNYVCRDIVQYLPAVIGGAELTELSSQDDHFDLIQLAHNICFEIPHQVEEFMNIQRFYPIGFDARLIRSAGVNANSEDPSPSNCSPPVKIATLDEEERQE